MNCSICLCALNDYSLSVTSKALLLSTCKPTKVCVLSCGHLLHSACLLSYLTTTTVRRCPLCREEIPFVKGRANLIYLPNELLELESTNTTLAVQETPILESNRVIKLLHRDLNSRARQIEELQMEVEAYKYEDEPECDHTTINAEMNRLRECTFNTQRELTKMVEINAVATRECNESYIVIGDFRREISELQKRYINLSSKHQEVAERASSQDRRLKTILSLQSVSISSDNLSQKMKDLETHLETRDEMAVVFREISHRLEVSMKERDEFRERAYKLKGEKDALKIEVTKLKEIKVSVVPLRAPSTINTHTATIVKKGDFLAPGSMLGKRRAVENPFDFRVKKS